MIYATLVGPLQRLQYYEKACMVLHTIRYVINGVYYLVHWKVLSTFLPSQCVQQPLTC